MVLQLQIVLRVIFRPFQCGSMLGFRLLQLFGSIGSQSLLQTLHLSLQFVHGNGVGILQL